MTTDRPLTQVPGPVRASTGPGERLRRLARRRRLVREEMLAVAVLMLFLAATVAVLATQWFDSGASTAAAPPAPIFNQISGSNFMIQTAGTLR